MNYRTLFTLTPLVLATSMALAEQAPPIETMVITATGAERSTLLAPASLSVISREQLLDASDRNLLSALSKTAGVSFSGRGVGGRKVIQLRGMESKHSLILIDSRRVSATDDVVGHSDFQYEWLPLDSIERLEVIRGPMSSLYGSEALGGVINIITRTGQATHYNSVTLGGTVSSTDEGGAQHHLNTQLGAALSETLTVKANLGYRYEDDVTDEQEPRLSVIEGRKVSSVQLSADWAMAEDHQLSASYLNTDEQRWQHTNKRGAPPFYRSWYDLDRQQWSLNWQGSFDNWTGSAGYYRSSIDVINHNNNEQVAPYTPQFLTDDIFDARFYRDFNLTRLTLGGEWREEELKHKAFAGGGDTATHKSVLLQLETDLVEDVYLTAGSRWDHHEYFGGEFSPRLYLVWELAPGLALKSGYGHGFKAPTLKQISPDYRFDGPHSFIGNGELEPETSDSIEAGLRYETPHGQYSLMLYKNEVEQLISTQCIANCGSRFGQLFKYVNVEQAEIKGLELEAAHQWQNGLQLQGSYSYTDGENTSSGDKLSNRPAHQGNIGISINWLDNKLTTALDWQHVGKQWVSGYQGVLQLPAYSLINANINYRLDEHRLTLSLNNLDDTDLLQKSDAFGYAEHGRRINLAWHWRFGSSK